MSTVRLALAATLIGMTVASCAVTRAGAWTRAQNAYDAGDYHAAIKRADELLGYGTPSTEERANAILLKAKCYERLGQTSDAVGLYAYMVKTYPQTPQGYQAAAALAHLTPNQPERGGNAF